MSIEIRLSKRPLSSACYVSCVGVFLLGCFFYVAHPAENCPKFSIFQNRGLFLLHSGSLLPLLRAVRVPLLKARG